MPRLLRKHKYGAQSVTVDGHRFDSKAEAKRYGELKMLERAGEVWNLKVHPRFDLHARFMPNSDNAHKHVVKIGVYEADFQYEADEGQLLIEDVKGVPTPLYRWKKKHFEAEYGMEITEITS